MLLNKTYAHMLGVYSVFLASPIYIRHLYIRHLFIRVICGKTLDAFLCSRRHNASLTFKKFMYVNIAI